MAGRVKHVGFEEIVGLLDKHIGPLYPNYNHHGSSHHAFTLESETFTIPKPHGKFVKEYAVKNFLEAMEALGLHEPEE